jgi:DNA-binding protein HU-beta
VNKTQLIDALAARYAGNRKAAAQALDAVLDTITREVARGEKVAITGFGSFEKRVREARTVRNPRTGEKMQAKKTAVPKFSPGADLKAVVSGAKKLPALTLGVADSAAKTAVAAAAKVAPGGTKSSATKPSATTSPAKKSTAKKSTAKKAPATAKKSTAKKSSAAKSAATKSASSAAAKKTSTSSSSPAKKSTAKKGAAKKSAAKKSS